MKSQISFKIEADMISQGPNQLATVKFENMTANLHVEGVLIPRFCLMPLSITL